jgi:hypothetical protein
MAFEAGIAGGIVCAGESQNCFGAFRDDQATLPLVNSLCGPILDYHALGKMSVNWIIIVVGLPTIRFTGLPFKDKVGKDFWIRFWVAQEAVVGWDGVSWLKLQNNGECVWNPISIFYRGEKMPGS